MFDYSNGIIPFLFSFKASVSLRYELVKYKVLDEETYL